VILIERSSGVQVGRDNEQFSAYRVTLPQASFESAQALAETLLSSDAPWSRDAFSNDARPDLSTVTGQGPRSSASGIIEGPQGNTLVIVRDSRGVQIGDRNVQRNEFRIRISDAAVRADTVGMTRERQECIARLRDNPGDQAAARRLAADLGQAARTELAVDLTAQVTEIAGSPQTHRSSGQFRDLAGRQVGGPGNQASVRVDVSVAKFDTHALEGHFREIAARLPRPQAPGRSEPGTPPSPAPDTPRAGDAALQPPTPGPSFRPGRL
jgi:hypothetical protein